MGYYMSSSSDLSQGKNEDIKKRHIIRIRSPDLGMMEAEQEDRGMIA